MQKSIATFWPPFHPQGLRRPVIFWNHPLPFKTYLAALQSGKTIALKERLPCPWPVSKLPGPSVSPPSLFSENYLSNVLQTDVKGREWMKDLIKIKSCFNASWSVCVSRSMVHGSTRELILYLWSLEQYLLRELNLELILFKLSLIPPALSSLFLPTLLVFMFPSSFQLFVFSFTFSILHPSDSFPFSSLLFSCSLFKCTCPKFNCNSWYRISWEGIKPFELILFKLSLIPPALSSLFFPTLPVFILPYPACIYSSLFFSTPFFLLYLLHPSDSFPFSSLLFSCSLFKCNCPKFNCNSWYRISWERHEIVS